MNIEINPQSVYIGKKIIEKLKLQDFIDFSNG
jgi:hypothetical protein